METNLLITYIALPALIIIALYWYFTKNGNYWKKIGVPYVKAIPIIGSYWEHILSTVHEAELRRYRKYGRIYGTYEGGTPILAVGEPELLKSIFVKDFQFFPNRRDLRSGDVIVDNMVNVTEGEKWKRIRTIITPVFTTGKIKKMMSIILESTKTLSENLDHSAKVGRPINAKKLFGAFSMDVIASSAFGTKIDSFNNPENEFVVNGQNVFSSEFPWRFVFLYMLPGLIKLFRISVFSPDATKFFKKVTLQIIEERRRTGQKRNDFLQMMMDAADNVIDKEELEKQTAAEQESEQNAKEYSHEENNDQIFKKTDRSKGLTHDELIAQCVVFFAAAYDTTATTLSFTAYELALNPDVQEKLISEIDEMLLKNEGKLTYTAIQEMNYLDNVVSETLRKHPAVPRLDRRAAEDYRLGDTGIVIPKGSYVNIPIYAIHYDPEHYPDPEKYDPNRFSAEEKSRRHPYAYLPFGAGPRNCIGMRFAIMEIKVCLAYIMSRFRFKRSVQTKVPLDYYPAQLLMYPKEVMVDVVIRKDKKVDIK